MTVLEQLLSEQLMDKSLAELLLGSEIRRTETSSGRMKAAYNICLFYTALVQAHEVTLAASDSRQLGTDGSQVAEEIQCFWNVGSTADIANGNTAFSFLLDCAASEDLALMAPGALAVLRRTRDAHELYSSNSRLIDPCPAEHFLALLRCLPLLRQVSFNKEGLTFTFHGGKLDGRTVKCYPYITFLDEYREAVPFYTGSFYILTSVGKGDRNGELIFNMVEYYCYDAVATRRSVRRQIANNENLLLVCKTIGIQTDWYPIDDCWCDLSFLKLLTVVSEDVLRRLWKLGTQHKSMNVIEKLRTLYENTDIYDRIDISKKLELQHIDSFLYEMFINEGVFKSLNGLLYDHYEDRSGSDMFSRFMQAFVDLGSISEETKTKEMQLCEGKIVAQQQKLNQLLSPETAPYRKRCCEIRSEQRAACILKAAGIKSTNLFPDLEEIRSIDDYYGMLRIHSADEIGADLQKVLTFLIKLYGALLKADAEPDPKRSFMPERKTFIRDVAVMERAVRGCGLAELFDTFIDLVNRSKGSPAIEKIIGRSSIYEGDEIDGYKAAIIEMQNSASQMEKPVKLTEKKLFLSYSHRDAVKVKRFVDKWRSLGINVSFDNDKFKSGDHWCLMAKREIASQDCAGVVVFMSRNSAVSDAVRFELEYAEKIAVRKYGRGVAASRFIFPVNLEDDNVDDYLREAELCDVEDYEPESRRRYTVQGDLRDEYVKIDNVTDISRIIRRIITASKIARSYDDGQLITDELETLLSADGDRGYVLSRELGDFEMLVANFYALLKYGDNLWQDKNTIDEYFYRRKDADARYIYPLVVSIKETKIKRDNITLLGYEVVDRNRGSSDETHYILTSRHLTADEYYCIPNYRAAGSGMAWMVEPLLINKNWLNPERQDT